MAGLIVDIHTHIHIDSHRKLSGLNINCGELCKYCWYLGQDGNLLCIHKGESEC